jgi:hypothetical protein
LNAAFVSAAAAAALPLLLLLLLLSLRNYASICLK